MDPPPWPSFHPGAGVPYPVDFEQAEQLVQLPGPEAQIHTSYYALPTAYGSDFDPSPIPSTSQYVYMHPQTVHSHGDGSMHHLDNATYASGTTRSDVRERTVIRGYDDFPLHAGPYGPYDTYPLSTAAEAKLPIVRLPAPPAASESFALSYASASDFRDSLHTPHLDMSHAARSFYPYSAEDGYDPAKRRYSQYETGRSTPERGSVRLVHDANGSASLRRVRIRPERYESAVSDLDGAWQQAPSTAHFAPAVPLWLPTEASVAGGLFRDLEQACVTEASVTAGNQPITPQHVPYPTFLSEPAPFIEQEGLVDELDTTTGQLDFREGLPPVLGEPAPVGIARPSPPQANYTPQVSSPASPGRHTDTSADEEELASVLAVASIRRALHSARPSPLTGKSTSGTKIHNKSTGPPTPLFARPLDPAADQLEEDRVLRESGRVNSTQQKRVASIEVLATCGFNSCRRPLARVVLRSIPEAITSAIDSGSKVNDVVHFSSGDDAGCTCLTCVGLVRGDGVVNAGDQSKAEVSGGYEATLSAAVDRLEKVGLGSNTGAAALPSCMETEALPQPCAAAAWESLPLISDERVPENLKEEALKCDVCAYICGFGTANSAIQIPGEAPFTVEIICARCDALFKCCSDCGGGGGRLTPGRWRSKELFPEGRKTCSLSHARNPALGEVSIDVLPVASIPAGELANYEAQCRSMYFNTRLAVIARPEYLISGDGLARSYDEVERVTVDHWNIFSELLQEDMPAERNIRRYLTMMYSMPRRRHPRKTVKKPRGTSEPADRVPFGFAISEADYNDATLCFCVAMPWPINGQAFDAVSMMGEVTTQRAKLDLRALNQQRVLASPPLPRLPPLRYNYALSPFRAGSRGNATLSRRGFEPLEELMKREPQLDPACFPPTKAVWLPQRYIAAMTVFVRRLEAEADLGGPPPENAPRKRVKKPVNPDDGGTSRSTSPASSKSFVLPNPSLVAVQPVSHQPTIPTPLGVHHFIPQEPRSSSSPVRRAFLQRADSHGFDLH